MPEDLLVVVLKLLVELLKSILYDAVLFLLFCPKKGREKGGVKVRDYFRKGKQL